MARANRTAKKPKTSKPPKASTTASGGSVDAEILAAVHDMAEALDRAVHVRHERYPLAMREFFGSNEWLNMVEIAEDELHIAEECLEAWYLIGHGYDVRFMLGAIAAQEPDGGLARVLNVQPEIASIWIRHDCKSIPDAPQLDVPASEQGAEDGERALARLQELMVGVDIGRYTPKQRVSLALPLLPRNPIAGPQQIVSRLDAISGRSFTVDAVDSGHPGRPLHRTLPHIVATMATLLRHTCLTEP